MTVAATISPTQSDLQKALGNFLKGALPPDVRIIAAQPNMVAEPKEPNFALMSVISFRRLRTNQTKQSDVFFAGSLAGGVLTVSSVEFGEISAGAILFGADVPEGTAITKQLSGTAGGTGTYSINSSLTLSGRSLSAGIVTKEIGSEVVVQLDFHSEGYDSAELAQTVSTLFRDSYATTYFNALPAPLNRISPLYADDPTRRPFVNDQKNYEWRWVLDAHLQINQTISVPQQYADALNVVLIDVDTLGDDLPSGPALGAGPP